jgi:hypothetical protein
MLICPRCERSLEGHDPKACARKLSRRFFFGLAGGALAALAVAPEVAKAAAQHASGNIDITRTWVFECTGPFSKYGMSGMWVSGDVLLPSDNTFTITLNQE